MNNTLVYINSMSSLIDLCRQLQGCAWLAVDTEFERTNTYYPQLCLVQISVPGTVAVVDPLGCIPFFSGLRLSPGMSKWAMSTAQVCAVCLPTKMPK